MSEPSREVRCRLALALVCLLAVGALGPAHAEPQPLSKEEQAKVDKAIDNAISFLKRTQTEKGNWDLAIRYETPFPVGPTALPALALLEVGVPANDPVIQKAAAWMRPRLSKLDTTYCLSLALLFFDRLGDPQDKAAIQSMALRLIAGQGDSGGWTYHCPTLSQKNAEALPDLLRRWEEAGDDKSRPPVPPPFNVLTVFQAPVKVPWLYQIPGTGRRPSQANDNSNTQFAILALCVARRHDVLAGPTLRLAARRFESIQSVDGSWAYDYRDSRDELRVVGDVRRIRAMSTVGLLGLALRDGLGPEREAPAADPDIQVLRGFAVVSRYIGEPTGQMARPLPMTDVYYLWSLERLAMLYDLPTVGGKDWYRWGAEILVTNQTGRGCWARWDDTPTVRGDRYIFQDYGTTLNTAFALLFLKRSHLVKDLTAKKPPRRGRVSRG
jgi:hypothetical protein